MSYKLLCGGFLSYLLADGILVQADSLLFFFFFDFYSLQRQGSPLLVIKSSCSNNC